MPDESANSFSWQCHEGLKVQFTPAPLAKRILAYVIDLGVVGAVAYAGVLICIVGAVGVGVALKQIFGDEGFYLGMALLLICVLALMALFDGYFVLFEYKNAQTLGKKLFGLSVMSVTGGRLTLSQVVIRALFRYIDCFLVLPGLICIGLSERQRRLGDLAAGTIVVYSKHKEEVSQFLYLTKEAYEYFKSLFVPGTVPLDLCKRYLAFAYPEFVMRKANPYREERSKWDELWKRHLKAPQFLEANEEMRLRFMAEHCFQTVKTSN